MNIIVDFETYSPVDITAGSVKYAENPGADIIVMGYKIGDESTGAWMPGDSLPEEFYNPDCTIYAHNALFDFLIWDRIGCYKYNFPAIPLERWIDTAAIANRYTLPTSLADVGQILGLSVQKNPRGKKLIKQICVPNKDGRPKLGVHYTNDDLQEFIEYCVRDVDTTYELIKKLPSSKLSELEQVYWFLTQEMNLNGLPVDKAAIERIHAYVEGYTRERAHDLPKLTSGAVEKATQGARIVKWVNSRGIAMPNFQAATIDKLLEQDLPADVREVLTLRQQLGRSSTAKYTKLLEMEHRGRVFNNLHYHGAAPGRWAGRGFQLHNLPRASVKDPEQTIADFMSFKPIEDAVTVAKALIRPMIKTSSGCKIMASDYKAIENRLLAWVADDQQALDLFRTGGDQYVDMAAFMYGKNADAVTKAERQIGKIVILGCGYGMGADRFMATAKSWGVDIGIEQATAAVNAYRRRYHKVKSLWYKLLQCGVDAVRNPGRVYGYRGCKFKVVKCRAGNRWLVLTLPSGRNMFYMNPYSESGQYGPSLGHYGTNPYSKKWSRLELIPGRVTENVIQGLARDVMAQGLLNAYASMPHIKLIGTVHDEAIAEIADEHATDETLSEFNYQLCKMPDWADGLPLEAEGWIGERYRK